ncbi:MAG: glycosyltransferase family 2 protein [Terriglobales bacterium]
MPRFSVVIPLYNKAAEVERAIRSVLRQSERDFELIVVNDGSTDGSAYVVESIHDGRLRIVHQSNAGVSAARNRGIAEATGEVVAFLDADDEWMPHFLSLVSELERQFPEAGAVATCFLIDKGPGLVHRARVTGVPEHPWRGLLHDYFGTRNTLWSSCVAIRKTVFETTGLFRNGLRMGEDLDMWFRIAAYADIAYTTEVAAVWHWTASNRACSSFEARDVTFLHESVAAIINDPRVSVSKKSAAQTYAADVELENVKALLRGRRRDEALMCLQRWRSDHRANCKWCAVRLAAALPNGIYTRCVRLRQMCIRLILRTNRWSRN